MKKVLIQGYYSFGSDIIFNSLSKGVAKALLNFAYGNYKWAQDNCARFSRRSFRSLYEGDIVLNGIRYHLEFVSFNKDWESVSIYFRDLTRSRLVRVSDHWCHSTSKKVHGRGRGKQGVSTMANATKIVNNHWELSGCDQSFEVCGGFGVKTNCTLPNGEVHTRTRTTRFEGGWVEWDKIQFATEIWEGMKRNESVYKTPSPINQLLISLHKED